MRCHGWRLSVLHPGGGVCETVVRDCNEFGARGGRIEKAIRAIETHVGAIETHVGGTRTRFDALLSWRIRSSFHGKLGKLGLKS